MLFHSIPGMEKIFVTDVERPKVILIIGPPGSMKTTFAYNVMTSYLRKTDEYGLYTTLEESVDSHLANMKSLGITLTKNMQISDISSLREIDMLLGEEGEIDYFKLIEKMLDHFRKKWGEKFTFFTLDSLGALYSLMPESINKRQLMFYFFRTLRTYGLFSFIIMEEPVGGSWSLAGNEGFLVDGIIRLGIDSSKGKLVRYIQVEKMRACEHRMEKFAFAFKNGMFHILGTLF